MSEFPPGSKKKSSAEKEFTPQKVVARLERDYLVLAEKLRKSIRPEELPAEMWATVNGILEKAKASLVEYNETKNKKRKISIFRELQGLGISFKNAEKELLKYAETYARIPREADPVIPQDELFTEDQVEVDTAEVQAVQTANQEAGAIMQAEMAALQGDALDERADVLPPSQKKEAPPLSDYMEGMIAAIQADDALVSRDAIEQFKESIPANIVIGADDAPDCVREAFNQNTVHENRWEFRKVMEQVKQKFGEGVSATSERFNKSKEYLNNRAKEIDASAKMSGLEKWTRIIGEKYNKLSAIHKLGIGVGLGTATAIGTAFSLPLALAGMAGLVGQRAFGAAGMFLSLEKKLQEKKVGESFQFIGIKERAALDAMLYTVVMGTAINQGIEFAREHDLAERTREWLGSVLGYETQPKVVVPMHQTVGTILTPTPDKPPVQSLRGFAGDARTIDVEKAPAVSDFPRPATTTTANIVEKVAEKVPEVPTGKIGFYDPSGEQQKLTDFQFTAKPVVPEVPVPTAEPSIPTPEVPTQAPAGNVDTSVSAQSVIPEGPNANITDDIRERAQAWAASQSAETPNGVSDAATASAQPTFSPPPLETSIEVRAPESIPTVTPPQYENMIPLENDSVEYLKEFVNPNNLPVDPLHGHVFQDAGGRVFAYGNDFEQRFNAAQEFAKANPDVSVFVQAEKPGLDIATGKLNPWVHEIRYEKGLFGLGGGMKILNPVGPISSDQVMSVDPKAFIKQLDK